MHPLLRFTLDIFEPNLPLAHTDKAPVAIKQEADFGHPRANRQVRLGQLLVDYEFNRGQRRSIGFCVGPDGLAVRAPKWVTLRDVDDALQAKASWILRKLQASRERLTRQASQVIDWRDGVVLPFLGQNLVIALDTVHRFGARGAHLVIESGSGQHPAALTETETPASASADSTPGQHAASRQVLYLALSQQATPEQIRAATQAWLMRHARHVFQQRLDHFAPLLGVQWKKLALSNASTRWGSARADGSIRLNWRLLHFSLPVLDYVVAHELSHLRAMDHSPRFWDTVRSVVPDYAALRKQLKSELVPRW